MKEKRSTDLENVIIMVLMSLNFLILTSIIWADERNVFAYYQSLLLISTTMLVDGQRLYQEMMENKEQGIELNNPFESIYVLSRGIAVLCMINSIGLFLISGLSEMIEDHLKQNKFYGLCFPSMFFVLFLLIVLYIIPSIWGMPYTANSKIRYEERESGEV